MCACPSNNKIRKMNEEIHMVFVPLYGYISNRKQIDKCSQEMAYNLEKLLSKLCEK